MRNFTLNAINNVHYSYCWWKWEWWWWIVDDILYALEKMNTNVLNA